MQPRGAGWDQGKCQGNDKCGRCGLGLQGRLHGGRRIDWALEERSGQTALRWWPGAVWNAEAGAAGLWGGTDRTLGPGCMDGGHEG